MVQRVQDAQQSQRDLVANVSHELKTPLTSIQGFAQSILDGVSQTPGEILQAAQVILGEANRMNRLVQDLVILARLEAGIVALQREPVNISALVRATVEKFRIQVAEAGLQLSVDVTEAAWVVGDADRLMQVLSNLLDNAVKYTPAGGLVRVSVQAQEGLVRVRVVDTGIGIEPVDRARIFERFYRADRDRSRAGMGLGLAITRQIVLAHGGAICVDPNFPQGCIFTLDLSGAGVGQVALP
jgi:signal transduction histidine kinase